MIVNMKIQKLTKYIGIQK